MLQECEFKRESDTLKDQSNLLQCQICEVNLARGYNVMFSGLVYLHPNLSVVLERCLFPVEILGRFPVGSL